MCCVMFVFFFFQAEDGIRDLTVTGVQTCALPILSGLTSNRMRRLVGEAAATFDWVIIDTPPVVLMPDANLLAAMADAAILVIGAGKTPYKLITRAVDTLGRGKIIGVVLNRVDRRNVAGGYTYGYYGER